MSSNSTPTAVSVPPGEVEKFTLETLPSVRESLMDGDFELLGKLINWLCADIRVATALRQRDAAVYTSAKLEVTGPTKLAEQLQKDWDRYVTPVLSSLLTWQNFAGVALTQLLWSSTDEPPAIQPWDLQWLKYENESGWKIAVAKSDSGFAAETKDITVNLEAEEPRQWMLLGYSDTNPVPWFGLDVGWQVVGPLRIAGAWGLVWWMQNAMHTAIAPTQVKTEGNELSGKKQFFQDLEQLGRLRYIEVPFGVTLEKLQSHPLDHNSPKELHTEATQLITEYLVGQSTTTRLETGSYNAVEVLVEEVSRPLLKLQLARTVTALKQQWLPAWRYARDVSPDVELDVVYKVYSRKEQARIASIVKDMAKAVKDAPALEADVLAFLRSVL